MNQKVTMGKLGEQLFIELFGGVQSPDEYDRVKDIVLDGRHVEVKAQNRHPTKSVFAIRDVYIHNGSVLGVDNVIKCFNVDRLIFVEYDHTSIIKLWECPRPRLYERYITKSNNLGMIGFPISQMNLLAEHENVKLANTFKSLSQSKVFKK